MIRPLRRTHAWLLPSLAAVVALALWWALATRPRPPLTASWPEAVRGDLAPHR